MERIKAFLDVCDLLAKVALTIIAFVFFGAEKERLAIQQQEILIAKGRHELTEALIRATQTQQASNLVVAERIITLLFEEKNKCISEDQYFMIEFLINTNNEYNRVRISKDDFFRTSAARRSCTVGASTVARDAQKSAALHNGEIPDVTRQDIAAVQEKLQDKGVTVALAPLTQERPQGYVSVGVFDASRKSFRNFVVPEGAIGANGTVTSHAVIKARWPVYLRANTSNTEEGTNAILGIIKEEGCAKVVESLPGVRGQTWAAVQLADCA